MNMATYLQHRRLEIMKANRAKTQAGPSVHQRALQIQEELLENQHKIMQQSGELGRWQNQELKRIADALDRFQPPVTASDL